MAQIHSSSSVAASVQLADSVEIGPGCHITGEVTLHENVKILGSAYLQGPLTVGAGTVIYPFVTLGMEPQDVKFKRGMPTGGVTIGQDCIFREQVSIHAATKPDIPTRIGNRVYMMINAHIGHDGTVGDDVTMVNNAVIGGHAVLGDRVLMGGNSAVHQFTRVGRLAMVAGDSCTSPDLPPFLVTAGRNRLAGVNLIGMRRAGMPRDEITAVRDVYRRVFRPGLMREEMLRVLEEIGRSSPAVMEMHEFVRTAKKSILAHPSSRGGHSDSAEES